MSHFLKIAALAGCGALSTTTALAQTDGGSTRVLQDVLDCRTKADAAARLACYDAAVSLMDQAQTKGDFVVVDRARARQIRKQAFGFTLPSMDFFSRGEKPEQINRITSKITDVLVNRAGKWVITLEDGAVWSQTDKESPARSPAIGMPVEIKSAAMGSYFFSVDGQRSFRAHRDK